MRKASSCVLVRRVLQEVIWGYFRARLVSLFSETYTLGHQLSNVRKCCSVYFLYSYSRRGFLQPRCSIILVNVNLRPIPARWYKDMEVWTHRDMLASRRPTASVFLRVSVLSHWLRHAEQQHDSRLRGHFRFLEPALQEAGHPRNAERQDEGSPDLRDYTNGRDSGWLRFTPYEKTMSLYIILHQ